MSSRLMALLPSPRKTTLYTRLLPAEKPVQLPWSTPWPFSASHHVTPPSTLTPTVMLLSESVLFSVHETSVREDMTSVVLEGTDVKLPEPPTIPLSSLPSDTLGSLMTSSLIFTSSHMIGAL